MMMVYQVFIFDLDGTIIDSEKIGLEALQATLSEMGIVKDLEELRFSIGIPGLRTLEVLDISDTQTALDTWFQKQQPHMQNVPIFRDILEVIKRLPKTGIVTSQTKKELQAGFERLSIAQHFQTVVSADDTEYHKPNPDPLQLALQYLNCDSNEAIYIGDSPYDMECAKSAGVDFGVAAWGLTSTTRFTNAEYIFKNPYEILQLTT
ncbi:HAD family hydrolase [Virgibacillus salexigens]|nr:HAD family hydrolase [Virgibacillus salexigens]